MKDKADTLTVLAMWLVMAPAVVIAVLLYLSKVL